MDRSSGRPCRMTPAGPHMFPAAFFVHTPAPNRIDSWHRVDPTAFCREAAMPGEKPSFPLAEALNRRDPSAADAVFARYAERLAHLADKHLSHRLASRLDGEEVVQSVFPAFFRRSAAADRVSGTFFPSPPDEIG